MSRFEFPSPAELSTQAHLSRILGEPMPLFSVTSFTSRARSIEQRLSARAACVLLVVHHQPGITAREVDLAIATRQSVLWVVLRGLFHLKLIDVSADERKQVTLTEVGRELVQEASA